MREASTIFLYACNSRLLHYRYYEIVAFEFVSWELDLPIYDLYIRDIRYNAEMQNLGLK